MHGIHSTCDKLHICRMAKDPRRRNAGFGDTVLFCYFRELCVKLGVVVVINEVPAEEPELEGRPGLDSNVFNGG